MPGAKSARLNAGSCEARRFRHAEQGVLDLPASTRAGFRRARRARRWNWECRSLSSRTSINWHPAPPDPVGGRGSWTWRRRWSGKPRRGIPICGRAASTGAFTVLKTGSISTRSSTSTRCRERGIGPESTGNAKRRNPSPPRGARILRLNRPSMDWSIEGSTVSDTHGADGFARAVALSVLAANLHRIGSILQKRQRKRPRVA